MHYEKGEGTGGGGDTERGKAISFIKDSIKTKVLVRDGRRFKPGERTNGKYKDGDRGMVN